MFEANDSEGNHHWNLFGLGAGRARAIYRHLSRHTGTGVNGSRARAPGVTSWRDPWGGRPAGGQEGGQGPAPLARTGLRARARRRELTKSLAAQATGEPERPTLYGRAG
ncbi:uncharacterized protein P174DRAFT_426155 [Aspergillus novofumigatus IBT 16806]|uniref:Uncharacterized protein n=1 Tax=Aspergillus novofumigatus (strain IBT 16806) TaxID=1392255 RepID=A0A2I1BS71_ASPN1|nr:uncharacterized protein P174DRAFT_426155 [Aspergillus novofumigatus IBT 16806]PKX88239.1 hypothetical protein P174DRAFT_426155 [Aspergillus novofumigatus IBT 16806]